MASAKSRSKAFVRAIGLSTSLTLMGTAEMKGLEGTNHGFRNTQLIQFKDGEYDVATATTVEEARTIVAAGYNYVTEKQGIMLFKRPKRFGSMTLSR